MGIGELVMIFTRMAYGQESCTSSLLLLDKSLCLLSSTSLLLKVFSCLIFIPHLTCCGVPTVRPTKSPFNTNSLALLSGTLRTYHGVSCGEEWMRLRCPTGTTISVQLAQFGRNSRLPPQCFPSSHTDLLNGPDPASNNVTCIMPTAIQTVVGFCQKKTSCKFQTSPSTFGGDPCPSLRKYVEVSFKCRPSEFKSVIGCEDEVIQLKCNRSSRLAIYSANYGRTEYESVQCPQPTGVPEESCLSSFATETVMQMCHGKRRCALSADQATFGSPCKPESRMYLKVIHTCVPRKVLQEKYQGEPDPDEMFEPDETEDDGMDSSVIEQPSIYSPDHSKGWPHSKNATKHGRNSLSQSSGEHGEEKQHMDSIVSAEEGKEDKQRRLSSAIMSQDSHNGSYSPAEDEYRGSMAGVQIVYLITQGINAYDFISRNPEKFFFYLAISTAVVFLVLVLIILVKVTMTRRRQGGRSGVQLSSSGASGSGSGGGGSNKAGKHSSAATGPILSSGLSDIDELSLDMESNDIAFTELPSILKRSSPFDREHADARRDIRPLSSTTTGSGPGGSGVATTTLSRSNEVVRFSNTLGRRDRDTNNPRSLRGQKSSEDNERFLYG